MAWTRYIGLLGLLALQAYAKKEKPSIKSTTFKSPPAGLYYFDDSDVVLVSDPKKRIVYRSEDAGESWKPIDGPPEGTVIEILTHPYDQKTAVVLTDKKHYISKDKGKSWKSFSVSEDPAFDRPAINFHATDSDRMLFLASSCQGFLCSSSVYYTTDGFSTEPKLLRENTVTCEWAKASDSFTTGDKTLDKDQILCVVYGKSLFDNDNELLVTSDYFKSEALRPITNDGTPVTGIVNLAPVKSYMVAAAKSKGTAELAMYVTDDTKKWHRAEFGQHKLQEKGYTLLESTNYSMQVDVMNNNPRQPMGVLLTSNANGTFFRKNVEHTNRNKAGYVDFEKIQGIQGIVMVNVVDNWEDVERDEKAEKKVKSKISFDDGRTWEELKLGDKALHLHSITTQKNTGRVYSSQAPGLVMGVGNTGRYLDKWSDGDTYVSDDAGLNWKKALDKPHFYEFGDKGGILVAIEDAETDTIKYSLNHGKDWEQVQLKDLDIDGKIQPLQLTTTPDSTSLKFILTASQGERDNAKFFLYAIDFEDLHERTCKSGDFEDWFARTDEKGQPTCIMGHTQKYRRRKANEKCFVNEEFKDPIAVTENCKCSDADYECDHEANFVWSSDKKQCVNEGTIPIPKGECKNKDDKYMGTSGYKLIPGNTCIQKGGSALDKAVERKCSEAKEAPVTGKIGSEISTFKNAKKFVEYYYLDRSATSSGDDETIVMRTDRQDVFLTRDHGKNWEHIIKDEKIEAIYPHQYINDAVYFLTSKKRVYYSQNRGETIHHFDAPEGPQKEVQVLQFHPTEKEWLIWTGVRDGQMVAHVSTKGGDEWEELLKNVRKCQFVASEVRKGFKEAIFCEQRVDDNTKGDWSLISSNDNFKNRKTVKNNIISFATMAEYIVVALKTDKESKDLKVDTSVDGEHFADAKFPPNFNVPHQSAYTVLDSSTHAVFLHVTVHADQGYEYGSIVKSNSNGTSYVLSIGEVNRNQQGYVDYEKMQGLEGVAVLNRVANVDEVNKGSAKKKLKTYITHNDGADWALLPRPNKEPEEGKFSCSGSTDKCSLHLHSYTERRDPRDTLSSPSAVGIMMATGNVGEYLASRDAEDAYTFLTRDAGITWEAIAKGQWQWEFGDQGSILVIVKEKAPTDFVVYSLDQGRTWKKHTFHDSLMVVDDITTVPSDMSRIFLLWGTIKGELTTVRLDFSSLPERKELCKIDDTDRSQDYEVWSPRHPLSKDDCLFGHVAQYWRKKPERDCYNGRRTDLATYHTIASNCSCERRDFECDYNYQRRADGWCELVPGLAPSNAADVCKAHPELIEYHTITGYRKIPLSTCQGGHALDEGEVKPCKGHEADFDKKHNISGAGLFFAIVLPIAAAAGIGYWVWKNWDGKFGRIQLGGEGAGFGGRGAGSAFDRDAPWIKYPVIALSGFVAVIAALPLVASSLWNAVSSLLGRRRSNAYARPYTSRSSFQRGRGNYSAVDEDEGELLGDDSEDEV